MAEGKRSILLYTDLIHTIRLLTDVQRGQLMLTIFEYVNDLNPVVTDPVLKVVFEPIKQQLKRDLKKYEAKKLQWSEAGKASAEARKAKKEDLTNVNERKQTSTVSTVSVNVNDSVNVNVSKEKGKNFKPPTLQEIKNYCSERKNDIDPERFLNFYESKGWMIGKNKMKDWRAAVRTWENKNENTKKKRNDSDFD